MILVTISTPGRLDDDSAARLEARVAEAVKRARAGEVSVLCLQPGQLLESVDVGSPPPAAEAPLPVTVQRPDSGTPMPMKRKGA